MLLEGLHVLDLTDENGFLCGKMLADLGADVVKVESPGGSQARLIPPYVGDVLDPDKSLFWFAFNTSKRSITLDITHKSGQALLKRLISRWDIVIESYAPGYMDSIGLGYEALSASNPKVIMTSITPFGQRGPYSGYAGSDLVTLGFSGYLYLNGDADRPPVRFSLDQACLHGGGQAASATILASYHRDVAGEGQFVDVSMQQCMVWCMMDGQSMWHLNRQNAVRQGPLRIRPNTGAKLRTSWHCKDGYLSFMLIGGVWAYQLEALASWIKSEGMSDPYLDGIDWSTYDWSEADPVELERMQETIANFFLVHTKAEIYDEAIKRRILLFPINDIKDVVESPQLAARGFWETVDHNELGISIKYPGAWIKSSETGLRKVSRAPFAGEHNAAVYMAELGLSLDEFDLLSREGAI